jgi:hypothetical protein
MRSRATPTRSCSPMWRKRVKRCCGSGQTDAGPAAVLCVLRSVADRLEWAVVGTGRHRGEGMRTPSANGGSRTRTPCGTGSSRS